MPNHNLQKLYLTVNMEQKKEKSLKQRDFLINYKNGYSVEQSTKYNDTQQRNHNTSSIPTYDCMLLPLHYRINEWKYQPFYFELRWTGFETQHLTTHDDVRVAFVFVTKSCRCFFFLNENEPDDNRYRWLCSTTSLRV